MLKLQSEKELKEIPNEKEKEIFCAKKNQAQRNQSITYRGDLRRHKWFRNLKGRRNSARGEKLGIFRRMRKNCWS